MNVSRLQALISKHSDDKLSEMVGHVYQVWQDGEITLQKCGELLWQRNLHMIVPGHSGFEAPGVSWPHQSGKNSYIFTTEAGAALIHHEISRLAGKHAFGCPTPPCPDPEIEYSQWAQAVRDHLRDGGYPFGSPEAAKLSRALESVFKAA